MQNLISALMDVLSTSEDEKKARDAYQGYEAGYHGYELAKAKDAAIDNFEKALGKVIDDRVSAAIAKHKGE